MATTTPAFEFTGEDYTPTFGGAFTPFEAKVSIEQVQTRVSSNGNPQIGVMVRLHLWTAEELDANKARSNRYANGKGRTAWAWKSFSATVSAQYLEITSDQISRLIGEKFVINRALTGKEVTQLAKMLQSKQMEGSIGTVWIVSPDNGETLTFWQSQNTLNAQAAAS